jgi:hypothetical protein
MTVPGETSVGSPGAGGDDARGGMDTEKDPVPAGFNLKGIRYKKNNLSNYTKGLLRQILHE